MAFLHADSQAEAMTIKHKLFAIRATGDSAYMINSPSFKPPIW